MSEGVVLSGGTGFLGREIVRILLASHPDLRLKLLVRPGGKTARERTDALVEPADRPRVETYAADISEERLGLSPHEYQALIDGTTRLIHSAATVRFDHTLAEARRVNVDGTRNMLALAGEVRRRGSLRAFAYVGTAFVAGERTGLVLEDELEVGQRFRNTYEQTKCEAEKLVREQMGEIPAIILRPSVIVGDSRTGVTSSFKTLYWPLKVYARRRWRTVPGYPDAVVDVVPVDYVAESVARLVFEERAVGRTVHLCAGPAGSAPIGEIARFAADFFGLPPPRFVSPALFFALLRPLLFAVLWGPRRRILRDGRVYRAYFRMRMTFDTRNADELLQAAGLRPPRVTAYLERLFRYCLESDWGSRPVREPREV